MRFTTSIYALNTRPNGPARDTLNDWACRRASPLHSGYTVAAVGSRRDETCLSPLESHRITRMNDSLESMKIGPLYAPKNPQRLAAWMIGNGTFAFFVYWTADSFFPQRELTAEAMIVKLVSAGLSFAVGLWLMHINHN